MSDFAYMSGLKIPVLDSKTRANEEFQKFADTAARLAAAGRVTDPEPTEAQKESGRYKKGRLSWKGLPLVIETAKGQVRSGKDWEITLKDHYGYVGGTESDADGDAIDVFISDEHPDSELVFIVNQKKKDGTFDEGKCVLGCITEDAAVKCYLRNYSPGWKGFGSIVPLTLPQFKKWIRHGNTARPIRDSDVSIKAGAARLETTTGVSSLVADERAMLQQEKQALLLLRRQGDNRLSKMAGELLSVLPGYGVETAWNSVGSQEQQQRIQFDELSLGNTQGTVEKQAERFEVHVQWENFNFAEMGGSSWSSVDTSENPPAAIRLDTGEGVYDTVKRAETHVTFNHTQRRDENTESVGERDWAQPRYNSSSVKQRGNTGASVEKVKTAATESKSTFENYTPHLVLIKRAEDDDRPFTICVDLDGTLAEQEKPFNPESVGDPRTSAVNWVRLFHEHGARIIIFTVRDSDKLVKEWLDENDVPYDYINENPDQPPNSSGKVYADVYWDDRAFNALDPDEHGPTILKKILAHGGDEEDDDAGPSIVISRQTVITITGPMMLAAMEDTNDDDEGKEPGSDHT